MLGHSRNFKIYCVSVVPPEMCELRIAWWNKFYILMALHIHVDHFYIDCQVSFAFNLIYITVSRGVAGSVCPKLLNIIYHLLHWFSPLKSYWCWLYHFFLNMLLFLLFLSCIHYCPTRNHVSIHSFIHPCILAHACGLSRFCHVGLFATLWTVAYQSPLFAGFSGQDY